MNCISDFFTYETTKSVVVKSWTIGIINRVVQLLIISYFVGWVFLHEKAYQVRDTAIESSVVTKVKGFGLYANRVMDVSDYVTPPQGTSVFVIITKMIVTENQMQGFCPESEEKYRCVSDSQCGPERFPGGDRRKSCSTDSEARKEEQEEGRSSGLLSLEAHERKAVTSFCLGLGLRRRSRKEVSSLFPAHSFPPLARVPDGGKEGTGEEGKGEEQRAGSHPAAVASTLGILTGRCVNYSSVFRTCEIQGWCPTEVDTVEMPIMMEAENFTIFIKNSIRFPLFNFEKGNLLPNLTARDMKTCRFHPDKDPFCPILRVGDVVKFAGQDFAKLARTGGVLGIKIGWVCDLDKAWDQCIPKYSFTRLDSVSEKSSVSPGYNFRFAKYYKMENGSEYRTLLKAFGIRFDVLVYGNAGKFNIIPTIISSVAAFTSVGVGTVLCDIILLNFLKGADQYKAKKFEEVNETTLKIAALTNPVYPSDQTTAEKQSTDSGAFSIGH
ncbi:P2X purinoceptor 3 isoform X3 [Papio anubis]|nr:P2X purinoceptor 3 isoform X3 [Papio anubis]